MMVPAMTKSTCALCAVALFVAPWPAAAHGTAHLPAAGQRAITSVAAKPAMPVSSTQASASKGCADPAICALETETAAQSTISTSSPAPALPPQPYDAAAPAAPPVVAAPSSMTLTPDVAVDSSSGGISRTSNPGAAGLTLADCMAVWEPALHMSKGEWRSTCVRTLNGVELPPDSMTAHADEVRGAGKHAVKGHHRTSVTPEVANN